MASDEPPPPRPPEANPNPREGFSLVRKRPRLCEFPTVPVCPDFLRRVCGLSPSQCMFAHPPPSVVVKHALNMIKLFSDKVTVCYASLWNMCRHGLACCYFHPPPHIHEALLKEMGTDYQRPGDMEVLGEQDKEESVGTFDTWELNTNNFRNLLAECILSDVFSIECVPELFQCFSFMRPRPIPSYDEIVRDVKRFYGDAKSRLQKTLRSQRVCLSTETWIDERDILHMALRGHWIDDEWKLCNKMLSFCSTGCPLLERKVFCKKIEKALLDWGISRMLTVTVDNTGFKDPVAQYLKYKTKDAKDAILGHRFLQIKSFSHVVAECAKEVLEYHRESVCRVRFAVLNVVRTLKVDLFEKCAEKDGIKFERPLFLNDKPMWDSTYMLLEKAVGLQKAFERFMKEDAVYLSCFYMPESEDKFTGKRKTDREEIAPGPPSEADWENARRLVMLLRLFFEVTHRLSNPTIVTANTFVYELLGIKIRLAELSKSEDQVMASLAIRMKKKIDEHWGDLYDLNPLLVVAMVLDPRYKLKGVKFCLGQAVNDSLKVEGFIAKVENTLVHLYEHYISSDSNSTNYVVAFSTISPPKPVNFCVHEDYTKSIRDQFAKLVAEEGRNHEVTRYLSDSCEIHDDTFDLLGWWRLSSFRYPTLSRIARDVLAIPVCAAFYEEAFSTEFRELHPKIMSRPRDLREILIVGQDWFRENPPPADYKESWIDGLVKSDDEDEEDEEED